MESFYHILCVYERLGGWDFPGGSMVKNPHSTAGDVGSISGRGTKIPHAAGQLSPRATTTELARLNERACASQLEREKKPAHHS